MSSRFRIPRRPLMWRLRVGWRALKNWRYLGRSVICPCCGWKFRELRPSRGGTPNVVCPACRSSIRQRVLALLVARDGEKLLGGASKVVHVAPEPSITPLFTSRPLEYVRIDKYASGVDINADITDLPFEDGSVDVVVCSHVLEHVVEDRKAMREFRRVLRPGGWAYLVVPFDPGLEQTKEDPSVVDPQERLRLYGEVDHVRVYGVDYFERLAEAGFDVEVINLIQQLDPDDRQRYALDNAYDPAVLCRVSASDRGRLVVDGKPVDRMPVSAG